jgi:hypothetical protein
VLVILTIVTLALVIVLRIASSDKTYQHNGPHPIIIHGFILTYIHRHVTMRDLYPVLRQPLLCAIVTGLTDTNADEL